MTEDNDDEPTDEIVLEPILEEPTEFLAPHEKPRPQDRRQQYFTIEVE